MILKWDECTEVIVGGNETNPVKEYIKVSGKVADSGNGTTDAESAYNVNHNLLIAILLGVSTIAI